MAILTEEKKTKIDVYSLENIQNNIQIIPVKKDERNIENYNNILDSLREKTRLSILVWGPGESWKKDLYAKRIQIKNELIFRGHKADFSEDIFPLKLFERED